MSEEPEDSTVSKSEKSDSKRARESTKGEHSPQKHTLPIWLTSRTWQLNLLIVAIGLLIVSLLMLLLLQPASAASKQVINLIQIVISWPIVIVLALLLLYKPISRFLESLGQNFQTVKISVLQFALEVSRPSAKEFTPDWLDTSSGLDLRLTAADDIISSIPSLFEQFKDNETLDYALIDIGDGKKWLTSRLFIFAIMLERMRGLRRLVFVQTTPDAYQRFLGTASPTGCATRFQAQQRANVQAGDHRCTPTISPAAFLSGPCERSASATLHAPHRTWQERTEGFSTSPTRD